QKLLMVPVDPEVRRERISDAVDFVVVDGGPPHAGRVRGEVGVVLDGVATQKRRQVLHFGVQELGQAGHRLTARQEEQIWHVIAGQDRRQFGAVIGEGSDADLQRCPTRLFISCHTGFSSIEGGTVPSVWVMMLISPPLAGGSATERTSFAGYLV